jgi:hypothetical protein
MLNKPEESVQYFSDQKLPILNSNSSYIHTHVKIVWDFLQESQMFKCPRGILQYAKSKPGCPWSVIAVSSVSVQMITELLVTNPAIKQIGHTSVERERANNHD